MTACKPEILSGLQEGEPGVVVVRADALRYEVNAAVRAIAVKVKKWMRCCNKIFGKKKQPTKQ